MRNGQPGGRIKALEIQSFEFVRAERISGGLRTLLRAIRTLTILAFGFIYLDSPARRTMPSMGS